MVETHSAIQTTFTFKIDAQSQPASQLQLLNEMKSLYIYIINSPALIIPFPHYGIIPADSIYNFDFNYEVPNFVEVNIIHDAINDVVYGDS